MNNREILNIGGLFEAETLRILRSVQGLTVEAQPRSAEHRQEAVLRYAGRQETVSVETKARANAATAWQLVHNAQMDPKKAVLLIAGATTAEARQILADHGIAFIDGLQNVHVELPGLMFHLEGRKGERGAAAAGAPPPTRLRGKAGVAAQALLLDHDREWAVRDLAEQAGIATGLAHRVLARLENEGIVSSEGIGPRRIRRVADPTALLDLWAEEQVDRPRRTLGYLLAQTPRQLIERISANLASSEIDYALTGAAGASLVSPFVTAIPVVEIWATAILTGTDLLSGARADPVSEGQNIVFLQAKDDLPLAFRGRQEAWVVNRFRLYVDLRRDPRRGREQADHLRREVIGF